MRLRKNTIKIISIFLIFSILLLKLLIIKSANWFLDNFSDVAFSTVVYQLFSPMKGTGAEILNDYANACFYPSIYLSLFFIVLYTAYDLMLKELVLKFDVRIGKKNLSLKIGNRFRLVSISLILGFGVLILGITAWNRLVLAGITDYIQSIANSSEVYENEYVNPNEVSIEFAERRNLLLIYMESMETTYASTDVGGGKPFNYIPGLTELAFENVYFSNDEDLGGAGTCPDTGWTMAGLLASYSGINYQLPIGGNSAGDYESFLPGLTTMGDILEYNGYQNYFMCGSEAVFGGRADFFDQHGNFRILDYNSAIQDGIIPDGYYEFWGMEDKYLYEYAKQELPKIAASGQTFNFTMLTVDTHHSNGYVCTLCDDEYPEQYANVIACADRQVCEFIDWVKEQDWYGNTTIVITGDHTGMKADFWDDIGEYKRRIYNCFINLPEELSADRTTNREFTVLDMFPTMLAAVGADIEGDRLGLGTNLFCAEDTLPEKLGNKTFYKELSLYSNYYYAKFIAAGK